MPKLPARHRLELRLDAMGCRLMDSQIFCKCGSRMKIYWDDGLLGSMSHIMGIDTEAELIEATVDCAKHAVDTHKSQCPINRR